MRLARHHSRRRAPPSTTDINGVIESLFRRHSPEKTLAFYARAAHPLGFRPTHRAFSLLVAAAKHFDSINVGESLHCHAIKLGLLPHLLISNSLVHFYASCDGLDFARQLFDEMPRKDTVSYNSMLDGYVKSGDLVKAENLFREVSKRNVITWSTLLNGYVRSKMFGEGLEFFHEMQFYVSKLNDSTIISLLWVYGQLKSSLFGRSVHGFLTRKWLKMPVHVSSALIDFYCKSGNLNEAVSVFNGTKMKDLICWNTLISGLGRHGRGEEAISLFTEMIKQGVKPDDITFIGVLVACAHSGLMEQGLHYFSMMSSKFGIRPNFSHHWCLVDLFVRVCRPTDALKIIQDMPLERESAIWGAVIWIAKVHGDIRVGECLGRQLIDLEPYNSRRYVPLVNVYAAASRWDKYKELQAEMKARGLKKLPDCTLIDLNVVVHKFDVGDKKQPENEKIYEVLGEIAEKLELQSLRYLEKISEEEK